MTDSQSPPPTGFRFTRNYGVSDILTVLVILGSLFGSVLFVYISYNKQFDTKDQEIALLSNRVAWLEQGVKDLRSSLEQSTKDSNLRQEATARDTRERLDNILGKMSDFRETLARGIGNANPSTPAHR